MATTTIAGKNYTYITSGATTQIATCGANGSVVLERVVVNKALTGTVKLIDNVTGTTANIATLTNGTTAPLGSVEYGITLTSGLRVVNSATEDITIIWRQG